MNQNLLGKANPRPPQHYRPQANHPKIESQTHYSSVAFTSSREFSGSHYTVIDCPEDNQELNLIKPSKNASKVVPPSRNPKSTAAPTRLAPQDHPGYYNVRLPSNGQQVYSNVTMDRQVNFQQGNYEVRANKASEEGVYELLDGTYEFDDSMPIRSIDEEEDDEVTNEESYPYSYAHVGTLEVSGQNLDSLAKVEL